MGTAAWSNLRAAVAFCAVFIVLQGCAGRDDYRTHAVALTAPAGFTEREISTPPFEIFALVKNKNPTAPWRVYLEGDGRAYVNYELSLDPTPSQTTLLDLMLMDPSPNILYLARPCQFVRTDACTPKYWSSARYGEDVLKAMQSAIMQIVGSAPPVELIGYSGGGTIAVLLAPRMPNVTGVRTIAANLSVREQTAHFGLTPLDSSLDPIDVVSALRAVPQIHLIASGDDKIIPLETVQHYADALHSSCAEFIKVDDVTHEGPWQDVWKQWQAAPFKSCN